jgi:hypothetical protein
MEFRKMEVKVFGLMLSGARSIAPMGRDNAASEDEVLDVPRTVYKETTPDRSSMFVGQKVGLSGRQPNARVPDIAR